jgi:hypothetical protein
MVSSCAAGLGRQLNCFGRQIYRLWPEKELAMKAHIQAYIAFPKRAPAGTTQSFPDKGGGTGLFSTSRPWCRQLSCRSLYAHCVDVSPKLSSHAAALQGTHRCELHIPLDALRAAPLHAHGTPGDCRARQEVRRRGGVPLHVARAGRHVLLLARDVEALEVLRPVHLRSRTPKWAPSV